MSLPCPYVSLIVSPEMARKLSERCKWGDDCKCKAWRDHEPPPKLSPEEAAKMFDV